MKLTKLPLYALTLAVFGFAGCSSDDKEETPVNNNFFTVDSQSYPLESGTIRSIQTNTRPGSEETVYEWDIFLSGSLNNKKHWTRFILNSSNSSDVPLGSYTYDEGHVEHEMGDFTYYITAIMRDATSEESEDGNLFANTDFKAGTVKVSKTGTTYTVTFDIVLDDNTITKGQFTGPLTLRPPVLVD